MPCWVVAQISVLFFLLFYFHVMKKNHSNELKYKLVIYSCLKLIFMNFKILFVFHVFHVFVLYVPIGTYTPNILMGPFMKTFWRHPCLCMLFHANLFQQILMLQLQSTLRFGATYALIHAFIHASHCHTSIHSLQSVQNEAARL